MRPAPQGPDLLGHRLDVAPAGGLLVVGVAVRGAPGTGQHDVAAGPGQLHGDRAGRSSASGRPPVTTATLSVSPVSSYVTRATVRSAPARSRTVASIWNDPGDRLEVRRRLRSHRRRPCPTGRARSRATGSSRGASSTRRADALAADMVDAGLRPPGQGRRATSTTARSTSRPPFAAFKAALRAGQHELPLRPGRDPATSSTTPTPRPSSSTPRFAELLDGIRDRLPGCKRWYVVADDAGAGPDWADAVRGPSSTSGGHADRSRPGPQRRRPAVPLHRRHHRHAEGRDVAPGRPVQRASAPAATPLQGVPPATSVDEVARARGGQRAPAATDRAAAR